MRNSRSDLRLPLSPANKPGFLLGAQITVSRSPLSVSYGVLFWNR